MKKRLRLLPYQTIWSIGRINWLRRTHPELLISLYEQGKLKEDLLETNKHAAKILSGRLMFTPDREAWDKTMQEVYPDGDKSNMIITKEKMKEIKRSLGLKKKLIRCLIKDRDRLFSKM